MCRDRGERIVVDLLPGEARKDAPLHLGGAQPVRKVGLKDGAWADFEKDAMPFTDQLGNRLGEAHGVSNIPPPVIGIERFGFDHSASHCRYQPCLGRTRREAGKICQEVLTDGVHRLRVESEILDVIPSRSKPNQGIVRVRNTTLNVDYYARRRDITIVGFPAASADSGQNAGVLRVNAAAAARPPAIADTSNLNGIIGPRDRFWLFLSRAYHGAPAVDVLRFGDGHFRRVRQLMTQNDVLLILYRSEGASR